MAELSAYLLRRWSVMVRWRDRVCQLCGARDRLQAHHINSKSYFPEQAYDLENGIALCGAGSSCHSAFHNKYKGGTRKKCTREDWEQFVDLFKWANKVAVQ